MSRTGIPRWRRVVTGGVIALTVGYALGAIAVWAMFNFAAERCWPATFLLFSPRWIWGVPVLILLPLTLIFRRRWAMVVGATAILVLLGPMRFRVPWRLALPRGSSGRTVRLVTANLHNRQADPAVIDSFLAQTHPDVVLFQDYSPNLHLDFVRQPGWHTKFADGLLIASRWPLKYRNWFHLSERPMSGLEAEWYIPARGSVICCEVEDPAGTFPVVNLHLASPHRPVAIIRRDRRAGCELLQENSDRRFQESREIARQVQQIGGPFILAGDFNTPDDSPVFRSSWADFSDAFDHAGFGFGTTYAKHHTWLRIDHVLYGREWHCRACYTSSDVGSGHRAVFAELSH